MSRIKLTLSGSWEFVPDPQGQFTPDTLPEQMGEIQVPGNWETLFPNQPGAFGRGWYRRRVELPADWPKRAVFLHFGAVNYYCQVWANGHLVGEHEGGYTPFHFRIDPYLNAQRNLEIVVKVVHPAHATPSFPEFSYQEIASTLRDMFGYSVPEIPLGKQNWYGTVSGIWQDVYLEAVSPTFVTQLLITPDIRRQCAMVRLGLHDPPLNAADLALQFLIRDQQGNTVAERMHVPISEALGENTVPGRALQSPFVEIPIENMRLWSLDDPHLYRLEVRLVEKGQEQDSFSARFGMREVSTRNNRVMLNDEPVYIIGALDQDFYPETYYTPPSVEFLADQVDKAKHMGLNMLRCHIKAPDPRYLDVADEKGILIWEELPNWLRLTEEAAARGRETITRMIERDFNHPSVIVWTIINESWGADLVGNPADRHWLKQMYHYVKRIDPTRLVVDNSPCNHPTGNNFHLRTDLEDFHIYFQIPDHYEQWNRWVKDFAQHPSWTFSPHGDAERTGEEPLICSEFGNWGLPTLRDLLVDYGKEPVWFGTGKDEALPRGVQDRFTRFHLDEIFGSYDQFAITTQWQQYFALKHEIEEMRKYPSIAGYVITEFTDLHWEANGLLNIWRRPKVFYHYLQQFQQQDILIANWTRLNFWEGDLCRVNVLVSHWSNLDLKGYSIDWNISELGVSGVISDISVDRADVRDVGNVSFVVPPLTEALRTRLHLRLRDRENRIVARNVQYLSFFPQSYRRPHPEALNAILQPIWVHDPLNIFDLRESLAQAGYPVTATPPEMPAGNGASQASRLAVVSRIDETVERFMEAGGTVLFLARSANDIDPHITERTGLVVKDRRARVDDLTEERNPWEGDWISNFNWYKHEPVFERIPRMTDSPLPGDLMDMQFYRVMPEQVLLGWDPHRDFKDIHAGLVVGWIHAPATLVGQCRWGAGKLLATALKLENAFGEDPVATVLMHNLLRYASSPRFRPQKDVLSPVTAEPAAAAEAEAGADVTEDQVEAPSGLTVHS